MTDIVTVSTSGAMLTQPRDAARATLVVDGVPQALAQKDATLWGAEATLEATVRLGWLDLPESSRELLPRLEKLGAELRAEGLDRVVLCGMGGSSLAPEVICNSAGVPLTVLDTTDPGQVAAAVGDRLDRTVVVVSSKSGGTIETDSQFRVFMAAFVASGLSQADAARRFVVVTDPESPLSKSAAEAGVREIFLADPNVGGRYSALSAFGLVPSALAGADVGQLLDDAAAVQERLGADDGNPGLELGAALGGGWTAGRDKLVIVDAGSGLVGFGDWAEQLVAESTGKNARGILPVVVESADAPGVSATANDVHIASLSSEPEAGTTVRGPLGAQFLVWEYATAIAGRVIGIDPFNQPNVAEAKAATSAVLDEAGADGPLPQGTAAFTDGAVSVFAPEPLLQRASTVAETISLLLAALPVGGYLAVMAYLDRFAQADAAQLRPLLAARVPQQVTFGWGPRFLHSTGQYHKGGPPVGGYLQITGDNARDVDVPGRPFSLGRLQLAQALGDMRALTSRDRPVVRLHLHDRAAGVAQLLAAARESA
ncbi:MAG: glucose-6-phosphate isomerase [Frankiaceae bacterium]|nr:glucose-6-phosphate isomerase [Frankiaceae bacterium]